MTNFIEEKSLDDLLRRVFRELLKYKNTVSTRRGETTELEGVLLKISNPRARLSRTERKGTIFSCLGELLWYLSGSNELEFIKYYLQSYDQYSDDGKTIYGGYGLRLFKMHSCINQIENVVNLLKKRPSSRRAVIQLYDASDLVGEHKDIPCTCTLQFLVRDDKLNMFTSMRSNDAFRGLPHDVFSFTMLQEIMARTLGVELGYYKHAVGSLHLYVMDNSKVKQFIKEGWQSSIPMPPMPKEDPWPSIQTLLSIESKIRKGENIKLESMLINKYWTDFIRLLQIYYLTKEKNHSTDKISKIKNNVASKVYLSYIEKRTGKSN